ncbi:MAG: G5 domain-containing protein [Mogibacterium sp.]|nr:G5 domain-containing protein [Mogibacterium sp.]
MNNKKHQSIGALILRSRRTRIIGAAVFAAAILLICLAVSYILPERVTVVEQTMTDRTETQTLTRAATPEGVLAELGMETAPEDVVSADGEIRSGAVITVRRGIASSAVIAGKQTDFVLIPGTVADCLALNNITYDEDDIITPSPDQAVTADTRIELKEVRKESEERQEIIEPKDIIRLDPALESGVIEETPGKEGEAVVAYTTTYINGEEQGTETEIKEWITEGNDHILRCGTSVTGEEGDYPIGEPFTANVAAYYFGQNATSAIGEACHYGTCAVDPSVIPYGTKLYIEGYGFAVANDSGESSRGTRIDVYMRNKQEAVNWGRQEVRVWRLSE